MTKHCKQCGFPIIRGQLYVKNPNHPYLEGPVHVSCPTQRQVNHALMFGRWTEAVARKAMEEPEGPVERHA
jgi:hypothetical protein